MSLKVLVGNSTGLFRGGGVFACARVCVCVDINICVYACLCAHVWIEIYFNLLCYLTQDNDRRR